MAAYFHERSPPEIQPDGLQTLYLMNPSYVAYADEAAAANMVLLNPAARSVTPMPLAGGQPSLQQHFVGVPFQPAAAAAAEAAAQEVSSSSSAVVHQGLAPDVHYNLWTPLPLAAANSVMVTLAQQTLSLSLSPHEMMAPASAGGAKAMVAAAASGVPNAHAGGSQSLPMRSKYLKAAQELLDELVSVGKDIITEAGKAKNSKNPIKDSEGSKPPEEEETSSKGGVSAELTTSERQELQIKKGKLANMLDEVEHRHRQYHHQMQIVVSSFEAVAGYGSARTYTALALKTISKQFRCLRDAIAGQIRATSKSLGEEDATKTSGSRLRFVDHHLRQQRALQHLGMIQHNTWRPQRGLPERSVSILRAWLFEHFLHPYPKDSDKVMLAKQTGLTRSQVSNWFINARVRLWKPMVEEMYTEEVKDQEQHADENASKSDANESSTPKPTHQESSQATEMPPDNSKKDATQQQQQSSSINAFQPSPSSFETVQNLSSYYHNEAILQPNLKKTRVSESHPITSVELKQDAASNQELLLKFMVGRHGVEDQCYPLIPGSTSHGVHYGTYPIGELERFNAEQFAPRFSAGGSVSLTLGLPHFESHLSLSGAQPSFLSSHQDLPLSSLSSNATVSHSSNGYESMSIQNRKRFAAAQLLPDFVT